jgi:hypothetical protein
MGKEKLAEYSDTILRTSSKTCIAALGILYADSLYNKLFSEEMKRIACFAFQGATQPLVDSFVVLCDLRPEVTDPPYPLCILSEKEFKSNATLRKAIGTPEDAFACIHELIRKGFFLPDHTHYRIARAGWHIVYGVTETSIKLKHLLSEANRYIKTCDV